MVAVVVNTLWWWWWSLPWLSRLLYGRCWAEGKARSESGETGTEGRGGEGEGVMQWETWRVRPVRE